MKGNNVRYLIVGTGRSGSSLLAAILADCGADFGLPQRTEWDRVKGAFEHSGLHKAYAWQTRANKLSNAIIPDYFGRNYFNKKCERVLAETIRCTRYAKSSKLVWLVYRFKALGYTPKVIIQYRRFEGYAASRYLKFGWSMSKTIQEYTDVYETALLQLHLFGGCVVSYEDVNDMQQEKWASALSLITGINKEKLLTARTKIVNPKSTEIEIPTIDQRVNRLHSELEKLKGVAFGDSGIRVGHIETKDHLYAEESPILSAHGRRVS